MGSRQIAHPLDREEAAKLLALNEEELYILLVPKSVSEQAYSREGLVARGQTLFVEKTNQIRDAVCREYSRRSERVKNMVDLTVLIGTILLASPAMAGIPVLPTAALLVKIGLDELCHEEISKKKAS